MVNEFDERSVKKINLIDKFRERFSTADNEKLKLPQIVVVGDQSSGKSSILEAISGIKLPRGVNTVTKCPVIIQMRHSDVERKQIKCRDDVFREIEDTADEINRVQRKILKNQISEEPVILQIESPHVHSLTIIDLPGIVESEDSDETENKEETHNIAKMYMNQENSLIICVLPANKDILATIKLASECNKSKSRIIGVLTKLDKLDDKEASLIPDILRNKKVLVKKGFYGLVLSDEFLVLDSENRRDFEITIFQKINLWTEEHKNRLGLSKFIGALHKELMILIDGALLHHSLNINKEMTETKNKLSKFPNYCEKEGFPSYCMMQISNGIVAKMENLLVQANMEIQMFPDVVEFLESNKYLTDIDPHCPFLFLWHSLFKRLYDGFQDSVKDLFQRFNAPYKNLSSIDDLIKDCLVDNMLVFNDTKPFKIIMDQILDFFKEDSSQCVESCCTIIEFLIHNVLISDIEEQFLAIKMNVLETCLDVLETRRREMANQLDSVFESEQSYFTQFQFKEEKPQQVIPAPQSSQVNYYGHQTQIGNSGTATTPKSDSSQYKDASHLKKTLDKYIENLVCRLGDSIPNFIRLNLFVKFKKSVESQLSLMLLVPSKLKKYFVLDSLEEVEWKRHKEKLSLLKQSKMELDEFRLLGKRKRNESET